MSSLTRFVVSVATISFGFLIVVTAIAEAQVPDATYFIEPPILGEIGAPVSSVHRITTFTPGFTGFGAAFCIDPALLSPLAIVPGDGLGPSSQIFFFDAYIDADGVGVGCILSGTGTITLPVGSGIELTVCQFQTIAGTSGEQASIEFCQLENNSGTSVITYFNWLYYQGGDYFPELVVGFPQFIRADSNIDGMIDLADVVTALFLLFYGIGEPHGCCDILDSNDDGTHDISDAIYTITYLFLGGTPPPPPFFFCGDDPTQDSMQCTVSPGGC